MPRWMNAGMIVSSLIFLILPLLLLVTVLVQFHVTGISNIASITGHSLIFYTFLLSILGIAAGSHHGNPAYLSIEFCRWVNHLLIGHAHRRYLNWLTDKPIIATVNDRLIVLHDNDHIISSLYDVRAIDYTEDTARAYTHMYTDNDHEDSVRIFTSDDDNCDYIMPSIYHEIIYQSMRHDDQVANQEDSQRPATMMQQLQDGYQRLADRSTLINPDQYELQALHDGVMMLTQRLEDDADNPETIVKVEDMLRRMDDLSDQLDDIDHDGQMIQNAVHALDRLSNQVDEAKTNVASAS
jgi:hypothetical protein